MLSWFKSYQSLVAKIANNLIGVTYSEKHKITYRTALGALGLCLGLLLFVIFCNDIYLLPLMGKLILFADDTTLLESHKNKRFLKYAMEHDINLVMNWFRANKLLLNISKTVVMRFWPTKHANSQSLDIADVQIPIVHVTKFLGVHLDEEPNWKYHANQVNNKLQNNKQLLNLVKNMLDVNTLIKFYYTHIVISAMG